MKNLFIALALILMGCGNDRAPAFINTSLDKSLIQQILDTQRNDQWACENEAESFAFMLKRNGTISGDGFLNGIWEGLSFTSIRITGFFGFSFIWFDLSLENETLSFMWTLDEVDFRFECSLI